MWIWGFDLGPPVSCNVSNWVSFKPRASGPRSICDWSLQRRLSDSMADYSCRSLACELCWHGILTSQQIMRSIAWLSASFRGFRKASAGKAEGVPATGLVRADSSVPVLDSRSGAAHNTFMSCTARLLLLFLPTTCCSNQWCVSIIEGTSLLLNCIFLWWENTSLHLLFFGFVLLLFSIKTQWAKLNPGALFGSAGLLTLTSCHLSNWLALAEAWTESKFIYFFLVVIQC